MSSQNNNLINSLKLKLLTVTQRSQRNGKLEHSLRSLERSLTEDITFMNAESNFILQQMQDLKHQVSEATNKISNTKVWGIMEKAKIDTYFDTMNGFKQEFDVMFAKGTFCIYVFTSSVQNPSQSVQYLKHKITELRNKELEEKQAVEEEMERQKMVKAKETIELLDKEAAAIERECVAIERECSVLTKRNKAIKIKLTRKLVEAANQARTYEE